MQKKCEALKKFRETSRISLELEKKFRKVQGEREN